MFVCFAHPCRFYHSRFDNFHNLQSAVPLDEVAERLADIATGIARVRIPSCYICIMLAGLVLLEPFHKDILRKESPFKSQKVRATFTVTCNFSVNLLIVC